MVFGLALAGMAQLGFAPARFRLPVPTHQTIPDDVTGSIGSIAEQFVDPSRILSEVGLGLFASGGILLVLLGWHNRQLRRSRDQAEALAADLAAVSAGLERANTEIQAVNAELKGRADKLDRRDRELGLQNRRFDAALNNMSQALCMVDAQERLVVFNRRFADLFAVEVSPIPGLRLDGLVGAAAAPMFKDIRARQAGNAAGGFMVESSDGRTIQVSHQPMPEGGWVATYEDVTAGREAEAKITFLAHHDALTRLLNRAAFERRLASAFETAGRFAVHLVDIDGFEDVNDGYGHPIGDALLREIGRRLSQMGRPGDALARTGGDEFAILRAAGGDREIEALHAERLAAAMREPFEVAGRSVAIGASVGVALAPVDGTSADALMTRAHLALGQAKGAGRGTARLFEPDMDAARRARRALERDLRGAAGRGEIELFFQPLVDARRVVLSGYETLARWRHPERGFVSPSDFVPVAEETGLIVEIGAAVLREACRQAARWPDRLTVAVNLSPSQFAAPDLPGMVREALRDSGLDPSRLEIEVTESLPLGEDALATLHAIRDLGVRIAMDDFGTGYASLSYLRRFPFDKIKIDQSFVRDMATRPDCIKIVGAMASLGASLGMITTAEGVETAEQFAELQAAGCDQVQGYHFGRPEPAGALRFTLPQHTAVAAA